MNDPTSRAPRWIPLACGLALVLLVLATFGRLIGFGHIEWDDPGTIFANPALRSVSLETIVDAWSRPHMAIFIPVTHTIWALLASMAEQQTSSGFVIDALPFRLLSLLLHAASALLVFMILRQMVQHTAGALLGASIFAIHPIQVEAVAWISGQKDLLAGFFTLAAIAASLYAADAFRSIRWRHAVIVLGLLAMLSKPQAVVVVLMIPVMLRAIDVPWRRAVTIAAPLLLPAIVLALVARAAQPSSIVPDVALWQRPIVALDALGWYAAKLLAPVSFAIDYGHRPSVVLALPRTYLVAAAVAVVIAVAWHQRRRQPLVVAGLAIAAIGPLPVLGLTRFDFQYYSTVADHYLYSGMLGVAIVFATLHAQLRWPTVRRLSFLIVVPLAALAYRQAGVWRDTERLMTHNLEVNPTALGPRRILAFHASQRGDDETAVRLLDLALATYPLDPTANYNRANALVRLGRTDEALAAFERAIQSKPREASFRHNYAIQLAQRGRLIDAAAQLERAVAFDPASLASRQALEKVRAMEAARSTSQPTTESTSPATTRP